MRDFKWMTSLRTCCMAVFLGIAVAACSSDPYADAPPVPPGFETFEEAQVAVFSGKVPLIVAPDGMPAGITEYKDIEYGKVGDRSLLLNLYVPDGLTESTPALIFIHGGGWTQGKKEDYLFYNVHFAELGYVTASISYRFSQEAKFPAAVQDAKCAVRWMRAHADDYLIDADALAVIGGSAGGHLSLMVGYSDDPDLEGDGGYPTESSRVQAVVNFYGVVDCTTPYAQTANEVTSFIGKSYEEAPESYEQASPIFHLTPDDPPTLTLHGTIDELVPIAQADTLHAKLDELGIDNVCDKFEGWPHTMDLAVAVNERCRFMIERFLEQHLQ